MNKHSLDIRTLNQIEQNMTPEDKEKRVADLQSKSDSALPSLLNFIDARKKEAEQLAADEAEKNAAEDAKENERLAKLEMLKGQKGK